MKLAEPASAPAWDAYDAYLFDIDGTLLHATDAVHYFAFCEALTTIAGRTLNLDGVDAHGNVDNGILRDALALAHVPDDAWRPGLLDTQRTMCRFVEAHKTDLRITVLPGVVPLLQHLRSKGAALGVATGNLEDIGRLKLSRAGLSEYFPFGGYSDAFEYRTQVFAAAVEKVRASTHSDARICVVGDTPADVRAAQANSVDVIATATGIFSFETLFAERPTRCVSSLEELLATSA